MIINALQEGFGLFTLATLPLHSVLLAGRRVLTTKRSRLKLPVVLVRLSDVPAYRVILVRHLASQIYKYED